MNRLGHRGRNGDRREVEKEREVLGRTWPVTGLLRSSSRWFLCRSSPGRPLAQSTPQSRGPPRPATSHLIRERLSWQPSEHVAQWYVRSRGGVTMGCADPVRDSVAGVQWEVAVRRCWIQVTRTAVDNHWRAEGAGTCYMRCGSSS